MHLYIGKISILCVVNKGGKKKNCTSVSFPWQKDPSASQTTPTNPGLQLSTCTSAYTNCPNTELAAEAVPSTLLIMNQSRGH